VEQALRAGELVARAAVTGASSGVVVAIPIRADLSPRVSAGDRIAVWISTKTCRGVALLSAVTVQEVRNSGSSALSSASTVAVMVRVPAREATVLAGALDIDGAVLRVGILSPDAEADPVGDLDQCAGRQP
jgi:hypothetical protein